HSAIWSKCDACSEYGPLIAGNHGEHGANVSMDRGVITASVRKVFSDTKGDGWNTMTFDGLLGGSNLPTGRWMNVTINDRMVFYGTAEDTPPGNGKPFQLRVTFPTSTNLDIRISHGQDPAWGPRFIMQYYRISLSNDKSARASEPVSIIYPENSHAVNCTERDGFGDSIL
ncbi:MAG: hypothetical protein LUQ25_09480, partial [Methanoregulaceae archaeon]|nr:hypothetical protein [Methanoregulaceae archaeon]